ncbi:hypothetical protein ACFXPX_26980 [Kitasatospora sp. NPDC059146]|uniref:hypothetical protein n=1 Tax=Kitasatospora sp. NPDC059146 TaxID=3346741 RepID=UPI0036BB82DF
MPGGGGPGAAGGGDRTVTLPDGTTYTVPVAIGAGGEAASGGHGGLLTHVGAKPGNPGHGGERGGTGGNGLVVIAW